MLKILLLCFLLLSASCIYDILSFGAVPASDTLADQLKNTKAILAAIKQANASTTERVVRIPAHKFYAMPIRV
jgi:hypothetical protein